MEEVRLKPILLQAEEQVLMVNQELLLVADQDNKVTHRLLVSLIGFGNKGDAVTVLRTNGDLVLVSNGIKKFSIDKINLSLCPAKEFQT